MINTEKYIKLCNYGFIKQSELARKCGNNVLLNVSNLRDGLNRITDKTAKKLQNELLTILDKVKACINSNNIEEDAYNLKNYIALTYFKQNMFFYGRTKRKFTPKYKEFVIEKLTFIAQKLEEAIWQDSEDGQVQP